MSGRAARRSDLAPSYQQNQHLWTAYQAKAINRQLPRLMVVAWDIPGVGDIQAMTAAINAHVRRQDTYHSWFDFEDNVIVRRTLADPEVIELAPTEFGHLSADQVRTHVLTTDPGNARMGLLHFRYR